MKKNMGTVDRGIRIAVAVTVAILFATNVIGGTLAIILSVVAGIFLVTSLVSFCPLYALVGLRTCPAEKAA